jgi:hypothetical protein
MIGICSNGENLTLGTRMNWQEATSSLWFRVRPYCTGKQT